MDSLMWDGGECREETGRKPMMERPDLMQC